MSSIKCPRDPSVATGEAMPAPGRWYRRASQASFLLAAVLVFALLGGVEIEWIALPLVGMLLVFGHHFWLEFKASTEEKDQCFAKVARG